MKEKRPVSEMLSKLCKVTIKEKIYPPHKLRDKLTIHGVTFHLDFLKSTLWLKHFEKVSDKPIAQRETRTRTVYPN